jgi:hypothetical protein
MKLGDAWQVIVGVRDVGASLPFYLNLGFQIVGREAKPYPWVQLTDGCSLLLLSQDGNEYAGITYFAADMEQRAEYFRNLGLPIERSAFQVGDWYQAMFRTPGKFGVGLVGFDGKKIHRPDGTPVTKCGKLAEVSYEVQEFAEETEFWKKAGFELKTYKEGNRWGTATDGMVNLGIYERGSCPHPFEYVALTYFENDMDERLARLGSEGFSWVYEFPPNAKSLTHSAILKSPDPLYFFLFTD